MEQTTWRKSTRSGSNSDCVEVAGTLDALRDSKNADGPVLRVHLAGLLADVKAGRYDA
jgi:uncharacterized protein DUF397